MLKLDLRHTHRHFSSADYSRGKGFTPTGFLLCSGGLNNNTNSMILFDLTLKGYLDPLPSRTIFEKIYFTVMLKLDLRLGFHAKA